jgi:sulfur-oxidizing protein SoxA
VWAHSTFERGLLEKGDLEEGLTAAASVGDDRIQEAATGRINPETFTHGTAEQRDRWFKTGFDKGEQATLAALAAWISAESKGQKMALPQAHAEEKRFYELGKRAFFFRGGPMDFSCASCHGEDGKRIRLQDLPNLTRNPGDGVGFAAWPAYRVSSGEMWSMQRRLNDCYREQRFTYPGFASDVTIALGVYMGVNAKGSESIAPALKR